MRPSKKELWTYGRRAFCLHQHSLCSSVCHEILDRYVKGQVAWRVTHATCDIQRLESRLNSGNGSAFKSSSISPPCDAPLRCPFPVYSGYQSASLGTFIIQESRARIVSPYFYSAVQRFFVSTWPFLVIYHVSAREGSNAVRELIFWV